MIQAYPLTWPTGWKRTPAARRTRAKFGKRQWQAYSTPGSGGYTRKRELTVTDGTERILNELNRMCGIDRNDVVISTNVRLRLDGLPRSGEREPDDPGVAVYWTDRTLAGKPARCMAIDIYDRVADNLGAVAATIEAMRAIERHGGAEILNRAFTGFTALPAPAQTKPWREVLGFGPHEQVTELSIEDAYRVARSAAHPDKGGTEADFVAVRAAYEQARAEVGA